jgi:hypothetical protein
MLDRRLQDACMFIGSWALMAGRWAPMRLLLCFAFCPTHLPTCLCDGSRNHRPFFFLITLQDKDAPWLVSMTSSHNNNMAVMRSFYLHSSHLLLMDHPKRTPWHIHHLFHVMDGRSEGRRKFLYARMKNWDNYELITLQLHAHEWRRTGTVVAAVMMIRMRGGVSCTYIIHSLINLYYCIVIWSRLWVGLLLRVQSFSFPATFYSLACMLIDLHVLTRMLGWMNEWE